MKRLKELINDAFLLIEFVLPALFVLLFIATVCLWMISIILGTLTAVIPLL